MRMFERFARCRGVIGGLTLSAALVLVGCGGEAGDSTRKAEGEPVVDASAGAKPGAETAGMPEMVETAVSIALAVEREPDRASEILKMYGMTGAEFEALLYDIAQDPDMAAAYALAMTKD